MSPPVLVLHAAGTNRDREVAWACERAGAAPEIVPMSAMLSGERSLSDYAMVVLPGGFSYGDALGAGRLWSVALRHQLGEAMERFIDAGRPVIGICNGFQALVKAGWLPALDGATTPVVTLTHNDSARFECRWVTLAPQPQTRCAFVRSLEEPIFCPVAHGEGKLVARDVGVLERLESEGLVALRYTARDGASNPGYPANPNGSSLDIAGICNPAGNVLGLMPHPEDHITPAQHPGAPRREHGRMGLPLFEAAVRYAAEVH